MIPYSESNYCAILPEKIEDRLDFNFNHPIYGHVIKELIKLDSFTLSNVLVGDIITGVQPQYDDKGEVLVIKTVDMKNRFIDYENTRHTSLDFYNKNSKGHLKQRDVLIASIGVGSVGKVDIHNSKGKAIFDGINLNVIRINKNRYNPKFLVKFLRSELGQRQIEKVIQGSTGMIYISADSIRHLLVPDISKTQQKQIVDKIDRIEKEANKIEKKAKKMYEKIEKNIYNKLELEFYNTTSNNYYSKASEEVNNRMDFDYNDPKYDILATYKEKSKYPFVKLSNLVDFLNESKNPMQQPDDEFLYVDISSIDTMWGTITPVRMLGRDATSSRMRRVIHKDNILVSTTRPTRNAIATVPEYLDSQICSTGLSVLKCKENVDRDYLFYLLRTNLLKLEFERLCSGSGYPEINQEIDLPEIEIPICEDIRVQQEIISKLKPIIDNLKEFEQKAKEKRQEAREAFEKLLLKS